jgi:type I restriction enzyme S subunit
MPPIEEQRRIVAILEDHLSRLDAADAQTISAEVKVAAWRKGRIDHLMWNSSAGRGSLSSLLGEEMRNGHSARATRDGSGIRTLTLTAVTRGIFSEQYTKMTSADPPKVAGLWLRAGDILVERSNTPELVDTSALYDGPDDWAIYPDLIIRLRVKPSLANARYVARAIRSERAHRWLRSRAKGLAGSMPKIDQGTIGALELPIPSLDEQVAVAALVDDAENVHERVLRETQTARSRSSALRRSLLQAAFSGRLTASSADAEAVAELTGV